MAQGLVERHEGKVPSTMDELTALPGVGRKTANVVLGNAFGIDEGIVVDTHVKRISNRLKLTNKSDPEKIDIRIERVDSWIGRGAQLSPTARSLVRKARARAAAPQAADLKGRQ